MSTGSKITARAFMERSNASDQEMFTRDAQYAAELATRIASQVPSEKSLVSGDLMRLQQSVSLLLRLSSKIEANAEAVAIMKAEEETP